MHSASQLTRADVARDPKSINQKAATVSYITHSDGLVFLTYFLAKLERNCQCGAFANQPAQAEIVTTEELKLDEMQGLDLDLRELAKQARRAARSDSDSSDSSDNADTDSSSSDSTIVAPGDEDQDQDQDQSSGSTATDSDSDFDLDPDSYEPIGELDLFGL